MKRFLVLILLSAWLLPVAAKELPVGYFVKIPTITSPTVSPDGKHIAALIKNDKGYYDVAVTDYGSIEFSIIAKMENPTDKIFTLAWANNERLIISSGFQENVGGFHFYLPRLYAVNIDGSDFIQINKRNMRPGYDDEAYYRSDSNIISLLEHDDKHILLSMKSGYDRYPHVYKVNIYTNEFEKLFFNDYKINSWWTDGEGHVLWGAQRYDNNGLKVTIWHRKNIESEWKPMKTYEAVKDETFTPVAPDETGKYLYVLSNHKLGREALWKYDVATGEFVELFYSVEGFDLSASIENGKLTGVSWTDDFYQKRYFDKEKAALQKLVQKTFIGAHAYITASDDADKKLIIYVVGDNVPPKYYLLDLEAKKASFWFSKYPYLEGEKMANVTPFDYTARDGMKLNGYFTMPSDTSIKHPPLIVLPHGGPWSRDTQTFDWMAQLFANRGYAVLQMNFRGSTGFGVAYEQAGYKEIGTKIQTDIVDAVNWAVKNTPINEDKMCIVGWSFGGYSALAASYQTPTLYNCFVSIAGVSDRVSSATHGGWRFESDNVNAIAWGDVTNPEEKELMEATSPIHHVREIQRPVLLVHGAADAIVSANQSENFYDRAIIAFDKDVTYVEIEHGTHSLSTDKKRITAFKAIDAFVQEHLSD